MKKLVVMLAVLAGTSVYAAEHGDAQSEHFHQAEAGVHEGTLGLSVLLDGEAKGTGFKADVTGQHIFAEYEMGFNSDWAAGLQLSYTQIKTKITGQASRKSTGLDDLELHLKGKNSSVAGLRYGANLSLALENGETKSNGDSNSATGGIMLTPYVGYEMAMDANKFGGRIARDIRLKDSKDEDKTTSPSTTTETSGGEATSLTAFFEHTMDAQWALGASLEYDMTSDSKPDGGTAVDEGNTTTFTAYAPVNVGPGTLIPSIQHTSVSADTDVTATALEVKYRMAF